MIFVINLILFYSLKYFKWWIENSQKLPPATVITPLPPQYTLEELETEILKKSSLCIDALNKATEATKGILIIYLYLIYL